MNDTNAYDCTIYFWPAEENGSWHRNPEHLFDIHPLLSLTVVHPDLPQNTPGGWNSRYFKIGYDRVYQNPYLHFVYSKQCYLLPLTCKPQLLTHVTADVRIMCDKLQGSWQRETNCSIIRRPFAICIWKGAVKRPNIQSKLWKLYIYLEWGVNLKRFHNSIFTEISPAQQGHLPACSKTALRIP